MIDNLEKKYAYANEIRGQALEQLTQPELISLLRDVHEANPTGDEDWKQDIRSALVRISEKSKDATTT